MSANPKLVKAYRRAVACSPFCTAVTITLMSFSSDTSEDKLYHRLYKANPEMFGKPLFVIKPNFALRDHNGIVTGKYGLRWLIRIIDRNAQELWQGVFNPETEKWDEWELKLYHRSDLGRAMRGDKPLRFTNKPVSSNLRARLTSGGHGCSVIHLQQNHIIGYDGIEGGDLKYVILMHDGASGRRTTPSVQMLRWGARETEQLDQAVWWQNHNYGSKELNESRPMTWGWAAYSLVDADVWEQRMKALTHGANTGAKRMWGVRALNPHLLPRFTSLRNFRSNVYCTPWDEAVYLVGREEKVAKVSQRRDADHKMLVERMHIMARMVVNGKRPSGAMVGLVKRLLGGITNEQLDALFKKYCTGVYYIERLAGYINHEIAARDARPKMAEEYAPDSPGAKILGGLL